MSALLGKGEDALKYLGELMTRFIQPNTMYKESGPVIETPLSASQSLHDMVCQSWGGVVRVFPALPAAWADLTVHDFRTQGAFLLSAVRRGGVTSWVRLVSEAGAPCVVRHSVPGAIEVRDGRGRRLHHETVDEGTLRIALRRGESALITAKGDRPTSRSRRSRRTGRPPLGLARLTVRQCTTDVRSIAAASARMPASSK